MRELSEAVKETNGAALDGAAVCGGCGACEFDEVGAAERVAFDDEGAGVGSGCGGWGAGGGLVEWGVGEGYGAGFGGGE